MPFEPVSLTDKLLQEDKLQDDKEYEIYKANQSKTFTCSCIVLLCIFLFILTMVFWLLLIVYN